MPEREALQHGNPGNARNVLRNAVERIAAVVRIADIAHAEVAQNDGALAAQDACQMQRLQHALDAVRLLGHVFQKQQAALHIGHIRRADQ